MEYEISGTGEPVVFIHGALIADTFRPLLTEPSLAGRYRLILYHRRGYAGSSRASGTVSITQQATDCRALLRHLGTQQAHVVGHSYTWRPNLSGEGPIFEVYDAKRKVTVGVRRVPTPERAAELLGRYGVPESEVEFPQAILVPESAE